MSIPKTSQTSLVLQNFLAASHDSSPARAGRAWTVVAIAKADACALCGRRQTILYVARHIHHGHTLVLDRACILAFIHLRGTDRQHPKHTVFQRLDRRLRDQAVLTTYGPDLLLQTLTPAQHDRVLRAVARLWHWPLPIPALLLDTAWPAVCESLTGVPPSDLSDDDVAHVRTTLVSDLARPAHPQIS